MAAQAMKAIVNANVVLEQGIIFDGTILLSGDRIVEAGRAREVEIPEDAEKIDAGGRYVGPGFIDLHVHGGNECRTWEDPVGAAAFFLEHGETSMLATPGYNMTLDQFRDAVETVKNAMPVAKNIKGLNFEGPFINSKYGANSDLSPWKAPIAEQPYRELVDIAGTMAKIWTIAPEREGIDLFVKYASQVNPDVVFSVGHSEATPAQIRRLGKYRPKLQTHSMDATGRLPAPGGTRGFGPDEYCFKEPDVYTELISDSYGIHVNAEMQQLLLHNKGVHRVCLITDSTVHHNPNPDHLAHVLDLNFTAKGGISGSKLTLDVACRNIMAHTNCGIAQAFTMASLNPAKVLGMDDELGTIVPGKIADLVFVDDRFNIKKVMMGGEIVVEKE